MAKHSYANCGRKNCWFCMNPRRRGELTIQEKRMNNQGTGDIIEQIGRIIDRDNFASNDTGRGMDKTGLLTKDSTITKTGG